MFYPPSSFVVDEPIDGGPPSLSLSLYKCILYLRLYNSRVLQLKGKARKSIRIKEQRNMCQIYTEYYYQIQKGSTHTHTQKIKEGGPDRSGYKAFFFFSCPFRSSTILFLLLYYVGAEGLSALQGGELLLCFHFRILRRSRNRGLNETRKKRGQTMFEVFVYVRLDGLSSIQLTWPCYLFVLESRFFKQSKL